VDLSVVCVVFWPWTCSYREFGEVRSKPGVGGVLRDHKKKAASSFCKIGGWAVLRWI
jgi:hypothetical protein